MNVVATTGAGDAFLGAFLYRVSTSGKHVTEWTEAELMESIRFANAAGGLATTGKGAIPSFGGLEDIRKLMDGLLSR
ncbi:PfkB family carbohydrate kinase [Paenibacillus caui]|uniref:PfkB family carbohydrate kinase n=1 Tax=Paenibacillus caui TaxID=2873927 RepID=UPI001CA9B9D1